MNMCASTQSGLRHVRLVHARKFRCRTNDAAVAEGQLVWLKIQEVREQTSRTEDGNQMSDFSVFCPLLSALCQLISILINFQNSISYVIHIPFGCEKKFLAEPYRFFTEPVVLRIVIFFTVSVQSLFRIQSLITP